MAELSDKDIEEIKEKVPKAIGIRIAEIRKSKGMTQQDLGFLIQNDRQYVSHIECADVSVSIHKLAIIARALEVPLSDITDGIG